MTKRSGFRSWWAAPLALSLAFALRCSGGSAGLPPIPVTPLRVIQAVQPADGSLAGVADPHLQAIPVSGAVVSGTITADVAIEVPVDQTYFLEVTDGPAPSRSGGTLVGNVVFASGVDSPDTSALFVSDDAAPIDLGELRFAAGRISPTTNPLDFVDANQNGIPDSQEPNVDPLRVLRIDPADGESGVDRDEEIELRFSLALDGATVSDATLRLEGPDGAVPIVIQAKSEGDDDAGRIEVSARDPLAASTRYTVVVTTGVRSTDGRALGAEFRSSFTTGAKGDGSGGDGSEDGNGGGGGGSDDGGGGGGGGAGGSDDGNGGGGSEDGGGGGGGGGGSDDGGGDAGSDDGGGGGSDDGSGGGGGGGSDDGSGGGGGGGSDDGSGGGGGGGGSDDGGSIGDGSGGGGGGGSDDGSTDDCPPTDPDYPDC